MWSTQTSKAPLPLGGVGTATSPFSLIHGGTMGGLGGLVRVRVRVRVRVELGLGLGLGLGFGFVSGLDGRLGRPGEAAAQQRDRQPSRVLVRVRVRLG